MTRKVFILATARKPELLPYATLVFNTIRVGFPSAHVVVRLNHPAPAEEKSLVSAADQTGCDVELFPYQHHHEWIENLVRKTDEPFWICDTDVIFYDEVESFNAFLPLAGYFMPEFADEFHRCTTRSRLHTSLMHINPQAVRARLAQWKEAHSRATRHNGWPNLFAPQFIPQDGKAVFYDTMGLLYHAIGGQVFGHEMKDKYFHFHFGTFSDEVLPFLADGAEMAEARAQILANPALGEGAWRRQERYVFDRYSRK